MDTLPLAEADLARCLADLRRINALTRGFAPTVRFLRQLTAAWSRGAELRLVELGCGDGAMLRRIHRWASARGLIPRLTGVDLNPQAIALARAATPVGLAIDWRVGDALAFAPETAPHVVTSALFAHHLSDADVVRFLARMEAQATHGWFVNDLHRHGLAFRGFRLLAAVAGWHRVVRHDGAVSVARAFTRADWARLLAEAGIEHATIRWHWPFRLCVARFKARP
ncbi:MAG: methyltransferase domain-containing protein [Thermaurantiacus sp.]|uniref:methyltransferase domain-containing protein n=1 Tax=Thermaurantiacus sp. TaxID=2820283 RepID=UPI00298F031D|nr:methyltransferase domain-containing protein [Thermaurantiacus sp.]MDW8414164.1 methyltransferase domain-containing protein [Thermaurantiacus sp.]